jgi:hypothetical protein
LQPPFLFTLQSSAVTHSSWSVPIGCLTVVADEPGHTLVDVAELAEVDGEVLGSGGCPVLCATHERAGIARRPGRGHYRACAYWPAGSQ